MTHPFGRTPDKWYLDKLIQGTKVEFNNGLIKGFGTIVGIASEGVPVLGRTYIIEPDSVEANPPIVLEYKTLAIQELFMQVIE